MYFRQILHEERSCASYVVGCPSRGRCAVVDPQGDPGLYAGLAEASGMVVSHVIDTHVHADHRSGARDLARAAGASLHMGSGAGVGFRYEPLEPRAVLDVGNRRMEVLHTPGHTPEHVCLLVDDWFVLTGDTLFVGDVGRIDLSLEPPDDGALRERARELYDSLQLLVRLRDDIELYPGHYAGSTCGRGMDGKPSSTIGRERRSNRALRMDLDAFVEFQIAGLPPLPHDFRIIKQVNTAGEASPVRLR